MEKQGGARRRVVLVPYPFQGHLTPMLQLGSILYSRGFSISVAHTKYNSPDPASHPEFAFHGLPDGLSEKDTAFGNLLAAIYDGMNGKCRAPLRDYLVRLMEEEDQDIGCVIYDNIMFFVDDVADQLKIPTIVLRTFNAPYLHAVVSLLQQSDAIFPFKDSSLLEPLPDLHPLRFKDIPFPLINNDVPEPVRHFEITTNDIRSSVACIWNSVDELEHSSLSKLQQHYKVPFFPIGPFHKLASTRSSTSLLAEDYSCLEWLDGKAPNSVVYVSTGSFLNMNEKDLIETAWGLANSGQPFLLAFRPGLTNGLDRLPEDFDKEIGDRGRVVEWAPQKDVLAHAAIGGFLSHCGWNSTLESICEGVPMICKPIFADQSVNARYLTQVWKVGLELEEVERGVIEKTIRKLMTGEEGREVRNKVLDLKEKLDACIKKDGSSYCALDELIEFISTLPLNKNATRI